MIRPISITVARSILAPVALFSLLISTSAWSQEVRIGVLGLFHPHRLIVAPSSGGALVVTAAGQSFAIEHGSSCSSAKVESLEGGIVVQCGANSLRAPELKVTSRDGGPSDFSLTIAGKISRHYHGKLLVRVASGSLVPIVSMDLETAVASVVSAESLPGCPIEALKAQAVAVRSYFVGGGGRHQDFDFCDTTHCQSLRAPPGSQTPAFRAAHATRGTVMVYQSRVIAAMYTRSCSGRTHTPAEIGIPPSAYPYFPAECKYCRQHPARWHSRISSQQADGLRSLDEQARLQTGRRLGWHVIQSNDFTMRKQNGVVVVDGVGQGHGVGLCQAGARAMADEGADFRQILEHYYPNTTLSTRPAAGTN